MVSRRSRRTFRRLRTKAEEIRNGELEKTMKKLDKEALGKKQIRAIEDLTRGIVNKLLHGPMQSMRSDGTDARAVNETLVRTARESLRLGERGALRVLKDRTQGCGFRCHSPTAAL